MNVPTDQMLLIPTMNSPIDDIRAYMVSVGLKYHHASGKQKLMDAVCAYLMEPPENPLTTVPAVQSEEAPPPEPETQPVPPPPAPAIPAAPAPEVRQKRPDYAVKAEVAAIEHATPEAVIEALEYFRGTNIKHTRAITEYITQLQRYLS